MELPNVELVLDISADRPASKFVLDGKDITQWVSGVSVAGEVGEVTKVTFTIIATVNKAKK